MTDSKSFCFCLLSTWQMWTATLLLSLKSTDNGFKIRGGNYLILSSPHFMRISSFKLERKGPILSDTLYHKMNSFKFRKVLLYICMCTHWYKSRFQWVVFLPPPTTVLLTFSCFWQRHCHTEETVYPCSVGIQWVNVPWLLLLNMSSILTVWQMFCEPYKA